ncbi:unnamed protein product [Paramecium sonneborni]|uniref:Uncharacterized protein n=1 Tax=Paramecium sonneborni TaxID=65129 RepID=A0A8S1R2S5_9CILI|nr:unnamed protein product [Paramecium sonneborni]
MAYLLINQYLKKRSQHQLPNSPKNKTEILTANKPQPLIYLKSVEKRNKLEKYHNKNTSQGSIGFFLQKSLIEDENFQRMDIEFNMIDKYQNEISSLKQENQTFQQKLKDQGVTIDQLKQMIELIENKRKQELQQLKINYIKKIKQMHQLMLEKDNKIHQLEKTKEIEIQSLQLLQKKDSQLQKNTEDKQKLEKILQEQEKLFLETQEINQTHFQNILKETFQSLTKNESKLKQINSIFQIQFHEIKNQEKQIPSFVDQLQQKIQKVIQIVKNKQQDLIDFDDQIELEYQHCQNLVKTVLNKLINVIKISEKQGQNLNYEKSNQEQKKDQIILKENLRFLLLYQSILSKLFDSFQQLMKVCKQVRLTQIDQNFTINQQSDNYYSKNQFQSVKNNQLQLAQINQQKLEKSVQINNPISTQTSTEQIALWCGKCQLNDLITQELIYVVNCKCWSLMNESSKKIQI